VSGADIANVVIALVYIVVQVILCLRIGHYVKTGRWFR
jgi:hypothetical protein